MGEALKLLFLCTGNSCRSQIAEGWTKALEGEPFQAFSAGVDPGRLDPRAVRVMEEVGIDISGHVSKHVEEFAHRRLDVVVTVCDAARESCPVFSGPARIIHRSFEDPPRLAADAESEDEALGHYRRIRDEIKAFVQSLPESLAIAGREDGEREEHAE